MSDQTISAGEFKAHCLQLLDEVQRSRTAIVITKRGRPVARLVPLSEEATSLFGCMRGMVEITGDLVDGTGEEWEADV